MSTTSSYGSYDRVAVATDNPQVNQYAKQFLEDHPEASCTDIATVCLLCLGLTHPQHVGLGGGSNWIIRERPNEGGELETVCLQAREWCPSIHTADLYRSDLHDINTGVYSICIPGDILGHRKVWLRFGRVSWSALFGPALRLAAKGMRMTHILRQLLEASLSEIRGSPSMSKFYLNDNNDIKFQVGELYRNERYEQCLRAISLSQGHNVYSEEVLRDIVLDIKDYGLELDEQEFLDYSKLEFEEPLKYMINPQLSFLFHFNASSGIFVSTALKHLYNNNELPKNLNTKEDILHFYSLLLNSFKQTFIHKRMWIDSDIKQHILDIAMSDSNEINQVIPPSDNEEAGTTHVSVLRDDGASVSVSATIRNKFGSYIMGERTGISFNNSMNFFKGKLDSLKGKARGVSFVSPLLVIDTETERVIGSFGSSGGSKILSSMIQVLCEHYLVAGGSSGGGDLRAAMDRDRVFNDSTDGEGDIVVDNSMALEMLESLKKKFIKNKILLVKDSALPYLGIVQGVVQTSKDDRKLLAISDYRKGGSTFGI